MRKFSDKEGKCLEKWELMNFCYLFVTQKTQSPDNQKIIRTFKFMYRRRESNPHSRRNWILNPVRFGVKNIKMTEYQLITNF